MLVVHIFWYEENGYILVDEGLELFCWTVFPNSASVEISHIFESAFQTLVMAFFLKKVAVSLFNDVAEFT